jgi:hypothetical protein
MSIVYWQTVLTDYKAPHSGGGARITYKDNNATHALTKPAKEIATLSLSQNHYLQNLYSLLIFSTRFVFSLLQCGWLLASLFATFLFFFFFLK